MEQILTSEEMKKNIFNTDINKQNEYGWTKLMLAVSYGKTYEVKELLAAGADPNIYDYDHGNALLFAASEGYVDIVKALIESGADIEAKDNSNFTPLIWAIKTWNTDVVELLKESGAKITDEKAQECW
ncbi:ankyrin repeat domain-containing protein [bacterium]|nr:ankyrin repeat domain-containing protein [bacterium]